jgi:stage II sporulation protein D
LIRGSVAVVLALSLHTGAAAAGAAGTRPAGEAPVVRVAILGLFAPRRLEVAAAGGDVLVPVLVAADGREQRLEPRRRVALGCGGAAPVMLRDAGRRRPAARIRLRAAAGGPLLVGIPGRLEPRPYAGRLEVGEARGSCRPINQVPLEHYVAAVTCREIRGAPDAALRAQAVVVRTWALGQRGRHRAAGADFCDTTHCQLYQGAAACDRTQRRALAEVRGRALWAGDQLARVAYASTCGGHTAPAGAIWGPAADRPHLRGVVDRDPERGGERALCAGSPHFRWRLMLGRDAVCAALAEQRPALGGADCRIEVVRRAAGGWVERLRISGQVELTLSGERFHLLMGRRFGWGEFKSANFTIRRRGGLLSFSGRGLGHGVGLCQHGAMKLARRGADHRAILQHYFPGTRLGGLP